MKNILAFTLFIGLGIVACQQSTSDNNYSSTDNKIDAKEIRASDIKQETLNKVIEGYLKIKDALVDTDIEAASYAAEGLLFELEQNENKIIDQLFKEVKLIAQSKDVEEQRVYFEGLSHNIYTLVKNTDSKMTLYQQYCPMAFENQGAYWLSDEKEIYNPYFGDKMLRCGRVIELLEF